MPVVKPELCFFEMKRERMLCHSMELSQSMFSIAPKRFNTTDVLSL